MTSETLRERRKYETNPFITSTAISTTRKREIYTNKESRVINPETGDIEGMGAMLRYRKVDNSKFVKIYTDHLGLWLNLSKNAQKMLQYVLQVLKKDEDRVYLDIDTAKKVTGYTSNSRIYDGINELIQFSIMARSLRSLVFYINPSFIFNGDRMVFSEAIEREARKGDAVIMQKGQDVLDALNGQDDKKIVDW